MAEETEGAPIAYPNFTAAKKALGSRPGQQIHHVVEQCQAKDDRSGFPVERINTTDNLVFLPDEVHKIISKVYSAIDGLTGEVLRNSLNGASWEEQYTQGIEQIAQAWKKYERNKRNA